MALEEAGVQDFGIRGVQPEPRRGYRSSVVRDRQLEAFSQAVWQRHSATRTGHPGSLEQWPTPLAFHACWPLLAGDLIVAGWKIAGASAADFPLVEETALELLDPPAPPELDWHDTYALELARHPAIAGDLADPGPGDGVERVLERAQLSVRERLVIRPWLAGDDAATIASDLGLRPQSVILVLMNARNRLRDPRWVEPKPPRSA
jgi:hypothetical protein